MPNFDIPNPRFPDDLDNNSNLFLVYNTSESVLTRFFSIEDDIFYIEPREFSEKEIWSHETNILNIEGEIIFANEVVLEQNPNPPSSNNPLYTFFEDPSISEEDKIQQTRVIAFKNLIRGLESSIPRVHLSGEWVRGYVMANHHNALKQAVLGIETLIGIDNSTDKLSLDFRLRDLSELVVEKDDLDCPYGIFWYETIESNAQQETVRFHISIIGNADRFEFSPDGETIVTNDLNPTWTYGTGVDIKATLKIFSGERCCSIIASSGVSIEPCEFVPVLPDIPEILCPEIDIPDVPVIRGEVTCVCPEVTCSITECPSITPCEDCIQETVEPTIITIGSIPTEINLNINTDINITAPSIDVNLSVSVTWANPNGDDDSPGACFKLLPCQSTTS